MPRAIQEQPDQERMDRFWQMVKDRLSATEFESLRDTLGATPYQFTALQNGTKDFTEDQINVMAEILGRDALELIMEYGLGRTRFRQRDLERMARDRGLTLKVCKK